MTEEEFRSGKLANGSRLMQPANAHVDLAVTVHNKGLLHLFEHFKTMQAKAAEYIEPDIYVPYAGNHATDDQGHLRDSMFIGDMLHLMDGPEQRAIEAEIEKPFDYVAEAALTCSPQWHGELVGKAAFSYALNNAIESLQRLDKIKKALFYGKGDYVHTYHQGIQDLPDTIADMGNLEHSAAVDYIHGVIGIATEAGELLEGLRDTLRGKSLDAVNVEEEVGDAKWYMAILARTFGFLWGSDERKNIAKLRARFPDKFTEYDANNRNLAAERVILETDCERIARHLDESEGEPDSHLIRLAKSAEKNMQKGVDISMEQRRGPIGDCEGMDC